MYIIQPHYHAIARTAQDYQRMAYAGVVAVAEPAFWAGFDREHPQTFLDYFKQISAFEPTRAAEWGIRHFCWVAVNPKEAENVDLARHVLKHMQRFLDAPTCLGIGETGLHKTTDNEIATLRMHLELAVEQDQLLCIHTPHLNDKLRGTMKLLKILKDYPLNPDRVWIDHVEEHTVAPVLDAGYWAGMTLYPMTKMTPQRAADVLEMYPGSRDRLMVNSSADWGPSDPFLLQECILECRMRGFTEHQLVDIFHNNPARFLGQNPKFDIKPMTIQYLDAPGTA